MKLSRERKIFVAVCGLALAALLVDRTLLAADGEGLEAADPSSLLVSIPGAASMPASARSAVAEGGPARPGGASAAAVAALLRQMAQRHPLDLGQTPDAFQPARWWVSPVTDEPPVLEPAPAGPDPRVHAFATHKLMSLIAGGRRGAGAMVDGQIVHLGQSLDGFRLVAVDNQSAVFEGRSARIRLNLNGEPQIQLLPAAPAPATPALSGP